MPNLCVGAVVCVFRYRRGRIALTDGVMVLLRSKVPRQVEMPERSGDNPSLYATTGERGKCIETTGVLGIVQRK